MLPETDHKRWCLLYKVTLGGMFANLIGGWVPVPLIGGPHFCGRAPGLIDRTNL